MNFQSPLIRLLILSAAAFGLVGCQDVPRQSTLEQRMALEIIAKHKLYEIDHPGIRVTNLVS